MNLKLLNPAKSLNKAYLKQSLKSEQIELFKAELKKTFAHIDESQDEDYHKNIISKFLLDVYCKDKYLVNVNKKQDLVIRNGNKTTDAVSVILEFKKPTEKKDMISANNANVKSLQQLVLYYLRETIDNKNHEITYLIVTNIYEWFVFDAVWFKNYIFNNTELKKAYENWDRTKHSTEHFYRHIAAKYLDLIDEEVPCTHFNLKDVEQVLAKTELTESEENTLLNLFKILSPEHLLQLPFANDSNSLNKEFYNELLYIIGLKDTAAAEGTKRIIEREKETHRNEGSLIENTITVLKRTKYFGYNTDKETEDNYFELALELNITWLNRILFLKLLEGQLIKYNNSSNFSFLNTKRIKSFGELEELFFEVLAIPNAEREKVLAQLFVDIPYLNSYLFERTDLEKAHQGIKQLKDRLTIPVYENTVLKDDKGKRIIGEKGTLEYLFLFLDAYDFASDSAAKIQQENKNVINASVLGLIFEKINGYKDGSFFTPSFITMYMCKDSIHKVVVRKFNEVNQWNCKTITDVQEKIDYSKNEERSAANEVINSIKICDPAVGSGHFLVSALNALIEVKSFLKILSYQDKSRVKGFKIEIENDELIIINEETDRLFEYRLNQNGKPIAELQALQEALFHEKQNLIENSLFGVDINPKSVMICRLRLWIELLKNMYYTKSSHYTEPETLPNIDINIKCGNSLISRFRLKDDVFETIPNFKSKLNDYKFWVKEYKSAKDKKLKNQLTANINSLTDYFRRRDPRVAKIQKDLDKKNNEFYQKYEAQSLFFENQNSTDIGKEKLQSEIAKMTQDLELLKSNEIFKNSFEWRFEFPEVLDKDGQFQGFDLIIGNPPYFSLAKDKRNEHYRAAYKTFNTTGDIYCLFYELGKNILATKGILSFITSNKWLRASYGNGLRNFLLQKTNPLLLIDFNWYQVFENASVDTNILIYQNSDNLNKIQGALIKDALAIEDLTSFVEENAVALQLTENDYWNITSPESKKLKQKFEAVGKPLSAWDFKINRGILTGLNEAFIIDGATKNKLIKENAQSADILKPLLRGRDVEKYGTNFQDLWLILFPKGFTIKANSTNNNIDNQLNEPTPRYGSMPYDEAWDYIATQYPAIANHLLPYKNKAENRSDKGDFWWELRACDYYDEFENEKLVWAETMRVHKTGDRSFPRFGYDNSKLFSDKTAFIGVGKNIKYLLAFLNSAIGKWLIQEYVTKLDTGGYMMQKVFLDKIPIYFPSQKEEAQLVKIIDKIIEAKSKDSQFDTGQFEKEIDKKLYDLYEITLEEQQIIEGK